MKDEDSIFVDGLFEFSVITDEAVANLEACLIPAWNNYGRNVYKFSSILTDRLLTTYNTVDSLVKFYQTGTLAHLPYTTFVVQHLTSVYSQEGTSNFLNKDFWQVDALVRYVSDDNSIDVLLYLDMGNDERVPLFCLCMELSGSNLSYRLLTSRAAYTLAVNQSAGSPKEFIEDMCHVLTTTLLAQILYLSAENADIQRIPLSKQTNKHAKRQFKYRRHAVGTRIYVPVVRTGVSVPYKKGVAHPSSKASQGGTAKSPHTRRAHFHTYHTKSGDVLHWLDPIAVNGGDPNTTVLHNVK